MEWILEMFEHLAQHVEFKSSTNAEFLLPEKRSGLLAHNQLQGVAFECVTPACKKKDIVLAYAEEKAPKEWKFSAWWTELACKECNARYLVGWSAFDGDGLTTVQRIADGS